MIFYDLLAEFLPANRLLTEEPMSKHTTFRIGGPAEVFAMPESEEELARAVKICRETGSRYLIIGDGANLLVSDGGIRGVVIQTCGVNSFNIEGNLLRAGTGARLVKISDAACKAGLTGLEFACGIPGTAGGAVYMNAGAYGSEVKDICECVTVLTDECEVKRLTDMRFGYRNSLLQLSPGYTALGAEFRLSPGEPGGIRAKMDELLAKRRNSQPLEYPSAGSVFKRPQGHYAGKLIQDAGLMGYAIGGAQVSEKHAGFIVNRGGAAADDVLRLVEHIQKTVLEKFNVRLEPEVKYIS